MPQKRLKQVLIALPFEKKLIVGGAILMLLSLFLPWYQDVDTFHTGNVFTGLTGPLYFVGLTFLVMASLTALFVMMDYLNRRIAIFNIKTPKLYLVFGIFSFYLLLMASTVYFDHNFGVNITLKESGYGMFMAFIAAALLTIGGYLNLKKPETALRDFQEETCDQIIKMPAMEPQKPRESLRTVYPGTTGLAGTSKNPAGEPKIVPVTAAKPAPESQEKIPQPIRMDL